MQQSTAKRVRQPGYRCLHLHRLRLHASHKDRCYLQWLSGVQQCPYRAGQSDIARVRVYCNMFERHGAMKTADGVTGLMTGDARDLSLGHFVPRSTDKHLRCGNDFMWTLPFLPVARSSFGQSQGSGYEIVLAPEGVAQTSVLLTSLRDDFGSSGQFGEHFGVGVACRDQRRDGEAAGTVEMIAMRMRDLADQAMGSQQE